MSFHLYCAFHKHKALQQSNNNKNCNAIKNKIAKNTNKHKNKKKHWKPQMQTQTTTLFFCAQTINSESFQSLQSELSNLITKINLGRFKVEVKEPLGAKNTIKHNNMNNISTFML